MLLVGSRDLRDCPILSRTQIFDVPANGRNKFSLAILTLFLLFNFFGLEFSPPHLLSNTGCQSEARSTDIITFGVRFGRFGSPLSPTTH